MLQNFPTSITAGLSLEREVITDDYPPNVRARAAWGWKHNTRRSRRMYWAGARSWQSLSRSKAATVQIVLSWRVRWQMRLQPRDYPCRL